MKNSLESLMGLNMTGGGTKKSRKSGVKKSSKSKKSSRMYKMGYFGGEPSEYLVCQKFNPSAPPPAPPVAPTGPVRPVELVNSNTQTVSGGAKMSSKMLAYKRYLENMNSDRLQKIAAYKGIKVTKKKDGKTVYVKKATLVRKLCECKLRPSMAGRKVRKSKKVRKTGKARK